MNSNASITDNLKICEQLVEEAHNKDAQLIVLPETFAAIGTDDRKQTEIAENKGSGPIQDFIAAMCQRLNVWIVAGTIPIVSKTNDRPTASCIVFDSDGNQYASYDKIHLFDASVKNTTYSESETFTAGKTPVVVDTPFIKLGLAVCYDLRFPELFRLLIDQGAEMVALPSAFTANTGKAHWETLLRARAIENQIWVIGSAQYGMHANNKETYGHSMIVNPWGSIVSCAEKPQDSVCIAKINKKEQSYLRNTLPCLNHRVFKS